MKNKAYRLKFFNRFLMVIIHLLKLKNRVLVKIADYYSRTFAGEGD